MFAFVLLPLSGCARIQDVDDFHRAAAKITCKQVIDCDPESWLAIDGQKACEAEQWERLRNSLGDASLQEDALDLAEQCLEEMAAQDCSEPIVAGFIPGICWAVSSVPESSTPPPDRGKP